MMAAGGGTAGDILSQHGVDTYRAVSWLREQFAAKPTYNTAPVHRLADETMRLLAAASRITVSHSRRVVSLADLVAASIEGELGFASAFWHASMANPAALTPLLRASPLNSELSAASSYVGGYEVSGLVARLFTLAEDARGGGAALRARISRASTGDEKQLTMRHVFIGFNRLVENGLAELPAPATDALRRLTGTLEAHPLFDDAGALLESRLDSGAIDALASSAKLLENTGHWLVDTRILTGVLLSVPGTSLDGGITPSEAAAVRMAGRRLLAPPADGGRSWKAALGTWQFNFSRNCQMTLLSAYDESVKHSSPVTTRAHLLLGVLNSPDRRAREFLSSQGVDPDALIELLSR
jgi:hypothetical protein